MIDWLVGSVDRRAACGCMTSLSSTVLLLMHHACCLWSTSLGARDIEFRGSKIGGCRTYVKLLVCFARESVELHSSQRTLLWQGWYSHYIIRNCKHALRCVLHCWSCIMMKHHTSLTINNTREKQQAAPKLLHWQHYLELRIILAAMLSILLLAVFQVS